MKKPNYYQKILSSLKRINDVYPSYSMGRHLATVIDQAGDLWGITDRELYREFQNYERALSMDTSPHNDREIDRIIEEGLHIQDILYDQEDDYSSI